MSGADAGLRPDTSWRSSLAGQLPKWWVGFVLAGVVLLLELLGAFLTGVEAALDRGTPGGLRGAEGLARELVVVVSVGAGLYWLYCIYRLHWLMALATSGLHPVTAFMALLGHLIPFYNLYWVFVWPNAIAAAVNERSASRLMRKNLVGVLVLAGFLARWKVDPALGTAVLFAAGVYVNSKLAATLAP